MNKLSHGDTATSTTNPAEQAKAFVEHLKTMNRSERRRFAKKTKTPMVYGTNKSQ